MIEIVLSERQGSCFLPGGPCCPSLQLPTEDAVVEALKIRNPCDSSAADRGLDIGKDYSPFYFKLDLTADLSGEYTRYFSVDISDTFPESTRKINETLEERGWLRRESMAFFVSPSSDHQFQCAHFTVKTPVIFQGNPPPDSKQMYITASAFFGGTMPFPENFVNPLTQFMDIFLALFLKVWFPKDKGVRIGQQIELIGYDNESSIEGAEFASGLRLIFSSFSG